MPAIRKISITDRTLKALKPAAPGKRNVVWDGIQPNLAVRVTDKGTRTFVVVRRLPGAASPTWTVLGQYPTLGLAEARASARAALGAIAEGKHPRAAAEARRAQEAAAARADEARTFGAVAEQFIAHHLPKLRTGREAEAIIRRELIPVLGARPIALIRPREVIALVEAITARGVVAAGRARPRSGGTNSARHARTILSKIFSWALGRDLDGVDANPCNKVRATDLLGAPPVRDRVLTDDEIRAVWRAAAATPYPFGTIVQTLVLTGQRLAEIAEASWSEVDLDKATLTIPAARMKNKAAHVVPLTAAVIELLGSLPRFSAGDYIFSTTAGQRPFSGFSKAKAKLDAELGDAPIPHWTLHDLRRSCRTGLATIGVMPFVSEMVIGHKQQGVAKVYDLHRYETEKRAALARWEAHVLALVAPEPEPAAPNVVALRPAVRS